MISEVVVSETGRRREAKKGGIKKLKKGLQTKI